MTLFQIAQATQPTSGRRHNAFPRHGSGLILLPQPPSASDTSSCVNTILYKIRGFGRFSSREFPNCIMEPFHQYSTLPEVVSPRDAEFQGEYRPLVPPKTSYSESTPTIPSADSINQTPSFSRQHSLPPMLCCVCNGPSKAWKCVQCDDFFCGECWPKERPHRVSSKKFIFETIPVLIDSWFLLFVMSYLQIRTSQAKLASMADSTKWSTKTSFAGYNKSLASQLPQNNIDDTRTISILPGSGSPRSKTNHIFTIRID